MGAWGTGTFENDDALDWIADFCESPSEGDLVAALSAAADVDGYVEAPDAANALAAAEVVAALKGAPTDSAVIADYLPVMEQAGIRPTDVLMALTLRAIDRVVSNSELKELWDEVDDSPAWYAAVAALRERVA